MKITVLIPVYNTKPEHLLECMASIKSQTYKDYDVLIIDDASTNDDTRQCLAFIKLIYGYEVYFRNTNGGTSAALNDGHKICDSEYIAIMGSDDVCDQNRLLIQAEYMKANPDIDVLGTGLFAFFDGDITRKSVFTKIHPHIISPSAKNSWVVNHGTVLYKNESVKKAGLYDINFRRGQDVNLWGRMLQQGFKFRNIEQVLYAYRRYKL